MSLDGLLALVSGRRGHFRLESGLHGSLWLDLDPLFADPSRIAPFVDALAERIRPHAPEMVCGPLVGGAFLAQHVAIALGTEFAFAQRVAIRDGLYQARYELPASLTRRVAGRSVAIVDDVMSAGSSLRSTHGSLTEAGAAVVVAGALLILGDVGETYFANLGVPVVAVARDGYTFWTPDRCPLCAEGVPLETP